MKKPIIMGILNITPDSFYSGSRVTNIDDSLNRINNMLNEGATIVDIGAASSRPFSKIISDREELERLTPFLQAITKNFPDTFFSIDTYNSKTAKICVEEYGFSMINDISAWNIDPLMFETIITLNVPYVLMHMKGTPENMQINPTYNNVVEEVYRFLGQKIYELNSHGISDIIIDPGFGFGKTIEHNYQLLKKLELFKTLPYPLLVGLSRKSMVYKLLNINPDDSLNGSTAITTIALLKGADIIRTHDIKETKQLIDIINTYNKA